MSNIAATRLPTTPAASGVFARGSLKCRIGGQDTEAATMKEPNCVCHWCGKPLLRQKQAVFVKFHFCDRTCKGEFQRTAKPVTREWLIEHYIDKQMDCTQIAAIVNRDSKSVWNWLKDLGIPTRPRGHDWKTKLKSVGCGEANPFYGKRHTEECKQRMRDIAIASGRVPYDPAVGSYMKGRKGADTPSWKGGITPERQSFYTSPEWKRASRNVIKRDNRTCQHCGKVKERGSREPFDIHHIVGFACAELRAVESNLVYLCEKCHYWVHGASNTENLFIVRE